MSNTESPNKPKTIRWPDMSAYGIHFGIIDVNGEPRMVMVDENGSWGALAKRMGFAQSRWFGLYVKSSLKLDIPGFSTHFPSAKVVHLTHAEIRDRILPLIRSRRDQRLSQMALRGRLSWHPSKTVVAEAANSAAGGATPEAADAAAQDGEVTLSAAAALRQTLRLGTNHLGQEVFESGDGLRFARSGDTVVSRENPDSAPSPVFLRGSSDEDLTLIASGMVREIEAGKSLHSDDFIRFIEAFGGVGSAEDKAIVTRFHEALDRAMMAKVTSFEGSGRDVFDVALKLHEGRPSFWRLPGTFSTPLPISVVMQSLAASRIQSSKSAFADVTVVDLTNKPGSHSWSLNATSVSGGQIPRHDVMVAGVYSKEVSAKQVSGVRVTRSDTESILESMANRSDDGLSVFVLSCSKAGKLDPETRRVISALGQRYEISGITDLDASLIGPGNQEASRILVVGAKRERPDYTFMVPAEVPVVYDYDSLWSWSESIRAAEFGDSSIFGEDEREDNRWQSPYIPASQISEPKAMSPRNLLGPVRKALARIVEANGMGIDEYVCAKLGWTMEELEKNLDAEQADAVAIGISAIDSRSGFVEADATGLGKGRVAAALALYGKRIGLPVVFMTEKSDLFADFYRDIKDIGAMADLGNPFIVNNELVVREEPEPGKKLGKPICKSPTKDVAAMTFACGEYPAGYDMVIATYSQFNRKYTGDAAAMASKARCLRDLQMSSQDLVGALSKHHQLLGLSDYEALGIKTIEDAIQHERDAHAAAVASSTVDLAGRHEAAATLLEKSRQDLVAHLATQWRIPSDLTTLKHQWLMSGALNGALVILDESHVAAGESSQTGENLRYLVANAAAVPYSSATFAKDIGNFILYSRLFPSTLRASNIRDTLDRGGEPMQEILSAMLAEDGRLVRREHDLSNLEFKVSVETGRRERNEQWANGFARVLAMMSYLSGEVEGSVLKMNEEAEAAAVKAAAASPTAQNQAGSSGSSKKKVAASVGFQYTNFSSKLYNLSRAFSMAVNADMAADLAIKALQEGRKPVITVENTMESVLRELVEGVQADASHDAATDSGPVDQGTEESDLAARDAAALAAADALGSLSESDAQLASAAPSSPGQSSQSSQSSNRAPSSSAVELGRRVGFKDILRAYVESLLFANKNTLKNGKVVARERINLLSPELKVFVDKVYTLIDEMPEVPISPLDLVKDRVRQAGYSIDEISGRTLCLEEGEDGNHRVVKRPGRSKQAIKSDFNAGRLDAVILSKSGSTGISLHASRTFADQSQRELIELQPAADIAQRLQFWGRVNRKGQVCSPIIHMLSSGLPAEMRLITMQNAKLRRMSANISGNADNSAINEDAPDILNRIGNEVAYRWMEANPKVSAILGYQVGEFEESMVSKSGTKFIDMLTGRLMMLEVDEQRRVYKEITSEFKAVIEQYEMDGRNPLKSSEFDLKAQKKESEVIQFASGHESVFDAAVVATRLEYPVSLPGLDRSEAEQAANDGRQALIEEWGPNFLDEVTARAETYLEAAAQTMLSKKYKSVEAALADTSRTNAIKNAYNRVSWMSNALKKLTPGSLVVMSPDAALNKDVATKSKGDFNLEYFYATGWKVPKDNPIQLSAYKIEGYSSRTRKKTEISLSAIMSRPSMWSEYVHGESQYKAFLDDFFNYNARALHGKESRVILEGNIYRAAEIADAERRGTAVTYTDEKGVWHHAIMLPKGVKMADVHNLPVIVDSADSLWDAIKIHEAKSKTVTVKDDFRPKVAGLSGGASYSLNSANGVITIYVYGGAEECSWLLSNGALKSCLIGGDYEGSRGLRSGKVAAGKEEEAVRAFMAAADLAGAKVLLPGDMRPWYNEYLNAKNAHQNTKKNPLDLSQEMQAQDDELKSLLAMTP